MLKSTLATLLATTVLCFCFGVAHGQETDPNAPPTPPDASAPAEDGANPAEVSPPADESAGQPESAEVTETTESTEATPPADEVGLSDAEKAELAAAFDSIFESEEFGHKLDAKVAKLVPAHVDAHLELVLPSKVNELVEKNVGPLVGVAVRDQLPSALHAQLPRALRAQRESFVTEAVEAMDRLLSARGVPAPASVSTTAPGSVTTTSAAIPTVGATAPSLVTTVAAPVKTVPVSTPVKKATSDHPSTMVMNGRIWYLNSDGTYHETPEAGRDYSTNCGSNGRCYRTR